MKRKTEDKLKKNTKCFLVETFIDETKLKENNISYPIKLEYYRTKNVENVYGIEVIKTEYRNEFMKIENEKISKITKDEETVNDIIYKLKENFVTPIGVREAINEIINKEILFDL